MGRGKTVDVAAILGGQLAKVSESDTDMRWIETERILDNPLNFYPKPTNTQLAELISAGFSVYRCIWPMPESKATPQTSKTASSLSTTPCWPMKPSGARRTPTSCCSPVSGPSSCASSGT